NVISSSLFVVTVGLLYSVVGTLNMADISAKISDVGQTGLLTVIAILFLMVFGIKGALFPLYFWLPGSYSAPPMHVLVLFGVLLTKVGIIANTITFILYIICVFTYNYFLFFVIYFFIQFFVFLCLI